MSNKQIEIMINTFTQIVETAKKASITRGFDMYIVKDEKEKCYAFTQEKDLYLLEGQKMTHKISGDKVLTLTTL